MQRSRYRHWLVAVVLGLAAGCAAYAQEFPSRVIRLVVPFPPGGSTDIYARIVAQALQGSWGQSTVVDNRPGATGQIGTDLVKRAPPDGYTLLFTSNTAHVLGPLFQNPRPFDSAADFEPLTKVLRFPLYLVVHPSVPAKSLQAFVALARTRPGQMIYASSGQGGTSHLVAELFNAATGIKEAVHVPFKGTSPALQSVMTGETHFIFNNIGVSQPLVLAGKLRGLAITGNTRSPVLPDVPTVAEVGIPGLENAYTWLGLLGPANLQPAVAAKISGEVIRLMRTPDMQKRILNDGYMPVANTPAQFKSEIQQESATWDRVVRARNIRTQ